MSDIEISNQGQTKPVEENIGQWSKNFSYWFSDGSIVLRVEDILYKIHVSMLVKLSPDMGSILAIPDGRKTGDLIEGTEKWPLHLPGLTVQEFEDFLTWVYRVEWTPMPDYEGRERIYTNLLKVSDLWQIEVGKTYAVEVLTSMYLPPTRRLELAAKFSIHDWVEPAVTKIFDGRISDLSLIDIGRIGTKVYSVLVNGMERMEMEIRRTANVEPPLTADPDWQCQKHAMCAAAWKQLWWDKLGRKLLHPDHPIKTDAILAEAKKMVHKDLNERCRQDVLQQMERNIVFVDKRVIAAVAAAIVDYHKTL
ncbi:hypothetical protein FB451DRAFT_1570898 [Mycena latifolia]|nr:hypothetical protein FB451DRAFT_1570898 [Mycena latifolia]